MTVVESAAQGTEGGEEIRALPAGKEEAQEKIKGDGSGRSVVPGKRSAFRNR